MKTWKYILVLIILVIIAGIFLALYLGERKKNIQNQQAFTNVQLANTILSKTRDKLNREVSTFKAASFTHAQLDAMRDSSIAILKSSITYWKSLVSHTSVESTTKDTLKGVPVHDTIFKFKDSTATARVFNWNDKWLTLHGYVFTTYANIDYSLTNKVSVDYYWYRVHWWKKQEFYGAVTQENPNTTTGKVIQFTVTSPQSQWYEKWWVHALVFTGAGMAIDHYLLK